MALVPSLIVTGVALNAAYFSGTNDSLVDPHFEITQSELGIFSDRLRNYYEQNNAFPSSLNDAYPDTDLWFLKPSKDGLIHDGWGHPFIYKDYSNKYTCQW